MPRFKSRQTNILSANFVKSTVWCCTIKVDIGNSKGQYRKGQTGGNERWLGINGHLRQKGKIAELALGYGGSVGALKSMGALEMGLTEEELQPLVKA